MAEKSRREPLSEKKDGKTPDPGWNLPRDSVPPPASLICQGSLATAEWEEKFDAEYLDQFRAARPSKEMHGACMLAKAKRKLVYAKYGVDPASPLPAREIHKSDFGKNFGYVIEKGLYADINAANHPETDRDAEWRLLFEVAKAEAEADVSLLNFGISTG